MFESRLNMSEKNIIRGFYDDLFNMKKVLMYLPLMERTVTKLLNKQALEASGSLEMVDWIVAMQRIIFLSSYLDRAPP